MLRSNNNLLEDLARYRRTSLSLQMVMHPWQNAHKLPHFLTDRYDFYQTHLMGHPCLLMLVKENERIEAALGQLL